MKTALYGRGSVTTVLSETEVRGICADALMAQSLKGKNVLVLIPDHTRHAPIDLFFKIIFEEIGQEVRALDYLVATGTHQPIGMDRIYQRVGITPGDHASKYKKIRFFNHEHDNPKALASIGTLPAREISELTGGLFNQALEITINKRIFEYDHLLLVTPVVPHEAMGFAGGNKYFFPGIAGGGVVETFHWLAAVITNPVINGVKDTPTRRVIDRATKFISVPRSCFAFAINDQHQIACCFAGEPEEAFSRAADISAELHIRTLDAPFRRILGITPDIYEEVWVAGKAMYKLEPVVADGGELIIYGPQVREISFVHGNAIRRVGYHVRDYFLKQWDRFSHEPKLILAHSTNVRGIGTFDNGVEHPRITVTLSTAIPEEICRTVNLGYRDPRSIDLALWKKGRGEADFIVENAGQDLYRLRASEKWVA
jgi:nickel-dependent lactate racemase